MGLAWASGEVVLLPRSGLLPRSRLLLSRSRDHVLLLTTTGVVLFPGARILLRAVHELLLRTGAGAILLLRGAARLVLRLVVGQPSLTIDGDDGIVVAAVAYEVLARVVDDVIRAK